MTTRQSLSRRQGKAALQKAAPLHIGISSDYRAYGVRIDWTDAQVVRIEARKDMQIEVIEAAEMRDALKENKRFQYSIKAGDVLYFARSAHGNFYYIVRWTGNKFCCTCTATHFHLACHHQEDVTAYATQSAANHKRMEEEAASTASSAPREEYFLDEIGQDRYVPAFRVNGGEWKPFLTADGAPVEIEGYTRAETWLRIYQQSSQVEADLWLEQVRESIAQVEARLAAMCKTTPRRVREAA